jgi:ubiquinone/menaquinone biosynthesis C-methylase UbiE
MFHHQKKSFQELFKDHKYVSVKNYLYNYLLRKRAIAKCLKDDNPILMLEVGSGISPLVTDRKNIVYSDISFEAISILKQSQTSANYVVADGAHLPFKANTYSHVICSEVIEHLPDDRPAISEMFRTLKKPQGRLILTVPHRKRYYGYDDRYVKHYRRYELLEIRDRLKAAGFQPICIQKILGPLEKITMLGAVFLFSNMNKSKSLPMSGGKNLKPMLMGFSVFVLKWINQCYKGYAWLDAKIMPRSFSTVILIESVVSRKAGRSHDRNT